jgi:hypothetical protein
VGGTHEVSPVPAGETYFGRSSAALAWSCANRGIQLPHQGMLRVCNAGKRPWAVRAVDLRRASAPTIPHGPAPVPTKVVAVAAPLKALTLALIWALSEKGHRRAVALCSKHD